MRPALDAKRLQLVVEYEPSAGIIAGDPNRLQQVFWNLVIEHREIHAGGWAGQGIREERRWRTTQSLR